MEGLKQVGDWIQQDDLLFDIYLKYVHLYTGIIVKLQS